MNIIYYVCVSYVFVHETVCNMIFVHTNVCVWCMYMHNCMLYVCECVPYNFVHSIHFLDIKLAIAVHLKFMTF